MTKAAQLPAELLSLVIEHLDQKHISSWSLVNKQFYNRAIRYLWQDVNITSDYKLNNVINTLNTSPYSPGNHVRQLVITSVISDTGLSNLIEHMPLLEHLQMDRSHLITDTSFQHIPRQCPQLISLDISGGKITQASMVALGQHCHQLSILELNYCFDLDLNLFSALQDCPLKEIIIFRCQLEGMEENPDVALAMAKFQQLTTLRLADERPNDYSSILNTTTINCWPHLTDFHLEPCPNLGDAMVIPFIENHPKLHALYLGYSNITDQSLDAMATHLSDVVEISVCNSLRLTATGVCRLTQSCPPLKVIHLYGCYIYVSDDDFPRDLHPSLYEASDNGLYMEEGIHLEQVLWMAGKAFSDD